MGVEFAGFSEIIEQNRESPPQDSGGRDDRQTMGRRRDEDITGFGKAKACT
jgi:hypothetical protein